MRGRPGRHHRRSDPAATAPAALDPHLARVSISAPSRQAAQSLGSITQPGDPGCLAHPGVDQVEIGLPAVSFVVLPAALDLVAVLADGRSEALVEGLALAPELPLALADAHLVDAADVPVVCVELVVGAVGGIAAVDTDAVGRLRHLHGRTLKQKLATLEPFEGGLGLSRPRLAAGRCRRLVPLADQHLDLLERLLRGRLVHGPLLPAYSLGL